MFTLVPQARFIAERGDGIDLDAAHVAQIAGGNLLVSWVAVDEKGQSIVRAGIFGPDGNIVRDDVFAGKVEGLLQSEAAVVATADGFVMSWTSTDPAQPDAPSTINAQLFDQKGEPIGEVIAVDAPVSDQKETRGAIGDDHSAISMLGDGRFVISWHTDAGEGDVRARIFDAKGQPQSDPFALTDMRDGVQESPALASIGSERFVAVWTSASEKNGDANGTGIVAQIFDAKGGRAGEPFLVNSETEGDQAAAQVASLGERGFAVVWRSGQAEGGSIHAAIFDAQGQAIGKEFVVAEEMKNLSGDPVIAVDRAGELLVTWAAEGVVHARLFSHEGDALGDAVTIARPDGSVDEQPSVTALDDGGFALSWTEHGGKLEGSEALFVQLLRVGEGPLVIGEQFGVDEDGQLVLKAPTLLENDTAAGGGGLALVAVGNADHGTVTLEDGIIRFTPDTDFNGTAHFDYTVAEEKGGSSTGTVTIDIAPIDDAPIAADDDAAVDEGQVASGSVALNDGDADAGSVLVYALTGKPIAGLTMADDGSYVFDATDPAYRAMARGETMTLSADYGVTDPQGLTGAATLRITVTGVNDAPVFGYIPPLAVDENAKGGTGIGVVIADDPEGQRVGYALIDDAGGRFIIDAATGLISTAPGATIDFEKASSYDITVRAGDDDLAFADQHVVIKINDLPETISGDDGVNRIASPASGTWRIEGWGGNDILFGSASGEITLVGGNGDDVYRIISTHDVVIEQAGGGVDQVRTALSSYILPDEVETLVMFGAGPNHGTGNALDNVMVGGAGADTLDGLDGNDRIRGGLGDDSLSGGAGDDRLVGGAGADEISGGSGADRLMYLAITDSPAGSAQVDRILDFSHTQGDRIDLSRIDGVAAVAGSRFAFIGDGAFTGHAGELRVAVSDGETIVQGDVNGDGVADIEIHLAGAPALVAADFIL